MTNAARLLDVTDVSAGYDHTPVLHRVRLSLERGEWAAVLGPNGSGKSTLLACIAGRLVPSAGTVHVDGLDLESQAAAAKHRLGYAVAPHSLPGDLTGRQCLEVFAMTRQMQQIDATTSDLTVALNLAPLLDQPVHRYSLGMRQKLSVLLALLGAPPLLLLDEVFNGLDPESALTLKEHLAHQVRRGICSVLLATHDLATAQAYCATAHLLVDGRLRRSLGRDEMASLRHDGGRLDRIMAAAMSNAPDAG